jgi:serine/threonine-protein kinase HipA
MNAPEVLLVQAWLQGQWHDAASLRQWPAASAQGMFGPVQLAYDTTYALEHFGRLDAAALSCHHPVGIEGYRTEHWPAFLVDCLPQGYGRQELLRQLGLPPGVAQSGDWTLLAHGAGNPIGNLRIAQAHAWLTQRSQAVPSPGFTRAEVAQRGERFAEHLAANGLFVAGSSGVQGEWPKILLSEDGQGMLHLDHQLPDALACKHYIVKFARGADERLNTILRLEAVWMALAQHLGLRVHAVPVLEGRALFIERFDRAVLPVGEAAKAGNAIAGNTKADKAKAGVQRHAQESLYSLCQREGADDRVSHNDAVQALARVAHDPLAEVAEYLRRDVANIVLGNKDNHGRNTAVQRRADGWVGLTPVYDFAPMYLHPDGIARRIRWLVEGTPDHGRPNWQRVASLCASAVAPHTKLGEAKLEKHLRSALHTMALAVADLPYAMRDWGVENDVVEHLRAGTQQHAELLAHC